MAIHLPSVFHVNVWANRKTSQTSQHSSLQMQPVGSLENVADLGTKFLERARLERPRHEVHLEAPEKEAEVNMIYEEVEETNPMIAKGDENLTIMEMMIELTLPMMMILALVGLITVCRMVVQCYRQRWPQPQEHYVYSQATRPRRGRVAHDDHKRRGRHEVVCEHELEVVAHIQGGVKIIV